MRFTGARRTVLIASTIAFVAALALLLTHRSEYPVILGRYSGRLLFLVAAIASAYGAISYACWHGLERFGRAYVSVAANLLGFVLLFVAVNMAAVVATFFLRPATASGSNTPGAENQERVHAELIGLDAEGYYQFRSEQAWSKNFEYEPWVGFKERPREGRHINVSPEGFRHTAGTPDNPKHWIFLLGGSTTFGYGVSDGQTIASYLQATLTDLYGPDTFGVRNFGRAYYYSAQEFVLLWTLLDRGLRPSMVIFIDGMNEGQIWPYYTHEMRVMFDRSQEESYGTRDVGSLLAALAVQAPIYPYMRSLVQSARAPADDPSLERPRPATTAADIASRYEASNEKIRLLTGRFNIVPFFVVQPMPGFRNNHGIHTFRAKPPDPMNIEILARMAEEARKDPQRVDLTGLLAAYQKEAFVDPLHYSPEVHKLIAHAIAERVATVLQDFTDR
jgi:hypothetical protein